MLSIHKKIVLVISATCEGGEVLSRKEIIDKVHAFFPEIKEHSIQPYDLCNNSYNKDIRSGKYWIFKSFKNGLYKVLSRETIKRTLLFNKELLENRRSMVKKIVKIEKDIIKNNPESAKKIKELLKDYKKAHIKKRRNV